MTGRIWTKATSNPEMQNTQHETKSNPTRTTVESDSHSAKQKQQSFLTDAGMQMDNT
jgi:cystathionine beta-lyase/cystathionine gamma-synthase